MGSLKTKQSKTKSTIREYILINQNVEKERMNPYLLDIEQFSLRKWTVFKVKS
jgi:hypothetical protein